MGWQIWWEDEGGSLLIASCSQYGEQGHPAENEEGREGS